MSKNKVYSTKFTLQRIVRYAFRKSGHAMNNGQKTWSHIKMINLPWNKLKQIAKSRSIKDYRNKSKEYLTKILSESKPKITL